MQISTARIIKSQAAPAYKVIKTLTKIPNSYIELKYRYSGTVSRDLKFVGPCIVIYFYSKTNQMHNISDLFYFGTMLYVFYCATSGKVAGSIPDGVIGIFH